MVRVVFVFPILRNSADYLPFFLSRRLSASEKTTFHDILYYWILQQGHWLEAAMCPGSGDEKKSVDSFRYEDKVNKWNIMKKELLKLTKR